LPHPALDKRLRPPPPIAPGAIFITTAQLRARYGGMSNVWVNRKVKTEPSFPRPYYFGESSQRFFKLADVEKFERQRVAEEA
jgi:hypothetical protein